MQMKPRKASAKTSQPHDPKVKVSKSGTFSERPKYPVKKGMARGNNSAVGKGR